MPAPLSNYLEKDLAPHYEAWRANPSPENTDRILQTVQPIVDEGMRTFAGGSAASPTLRGKAKLLTIKALHGYDPSRARLKTHLLTQLQGVRRLTAREEQIVRIPEGVSADRARMRASAEALHEQHGRDPSDAEIAEHSGLSMRRMANLRNAPGSFAESTMTRIDTEGSSVWTPPVTQQMGPDLRHMWWQAVYHDLDPTDQVILEHSVGMNGKPILTNQEVAKRLRISPGAISQRRTRIQSKLDTAADIGLFG